MHIKNGLAGISCILLILLDQWVKYWAKIHLRHSTSQTIIPNFIGLTYVENRGAAFGFMQGGRWIFVVLTIAVAIGIIIYYAGLPRERKYWLVRIPLIFIFSGAIGNFIDRLRFGYVVDMFEFLFIRFPVFNVADICLVTGTFTLAFVFVFIIKDTPVHDKPKG
jgi:signal peptidase II